MADKKIEKALYGPSATEVALGAILGFLLGVVTACVYLVLFKPVTTVREPVKEPVAGVVYYQPGTNDSSRNRQWTAKHRRFLAGGSIEVNEDEINSWVASELKKPAAPAGGKAGGAPAPSGSFLTAQPPNFRIVDGTMQVGFLCRIDYFGVGRDVQVVARGKGFTKDDNRFEFEADEFYLGSCPLHKLFGLGLPLMSKLSSLHTPSDEMKAAWAKLTEVQLEGRTLKLTVP
ncbi:MAG TPA: hypothetical protein VEB66_15140 [Opitutaceae bacterium]|nr:hypothetical protein [Opitutaceae bacterium]